LIDDWREQQMVKFILLLTYNVDELLHGFNQKRIWKLAWSARNLLELAIWVEYCNFSPANARQFRDDSARDLLGTAASIQKQFELGVGKLSQFGELLRIKVSGVAGRLQRRRERLYRSTA
jgi:hypothetical protein